MSANVFSYFRRPRTLQEKKWNLAHRGFVRQKRAHLPSSWDDIYRSRDYTQSWKLCTRLKRQWLSWPLNDDTVDYRPQRQDPWKV
jgi:hypothetical protein